ncbi:hypothetical protein GCM10022226_83350 [Sphaerisporangium flaviroseum]|uniref:Uncharacterized protein n=1 Tax=Sphaerisporangium flaviroseum TaxID=509199 RepID=A0ABP7JKH9_9ACTN
MLVQVGSRGLSGVHVLLLCSPERIVEIVAETAWFWLIIGVGAQARRDLAVFGVSDAIAAYSLELQPCVE